LISKSGDVEEIS